MASKLIYFDLETTSLGKATEVCQIAALVGQEHFSAYILPNYDISSESSQALSLCRF